MMKKVFGCEKGESGLGLIIVFVNIDLVILIYALTLVSFYFLGLIK